MHYVIRGHKVMLDVDLAELYGVTTKRLNEQVKRNRDRFFRQYFTGLRFKSFYRQNENGAKDKHLR